MPVPKAKYRYWVTYLLKDLQVGDNFKAGVLHLTVIPWFVTDLDDKEVIEAFNHNFAEQPAFEATVGKVTDFKHKRKIPVNLVTPIVEILALHSKSLQLFEDLQARWSVHTPHVGSDYIPHIRRRAGSRLRSGDKLQIDSVYLIKSARTEDGQRTVAAKVDLI